MGGAATVKRHGLNCRTGKGNQTAGPERWSDNWWRAPIAKVVGSTLPIGKRIFTNRFNVVWPREWILLFAPITLARRLADGSETCLQAVSKAPVAGTLAVELRARPAAAARTAVVEVRSLGITLQGPYRKGKRMEELRVNILELRESAPPEATEPLHWFLLTSLSCKRWAEIQRVIGRYCARWWVEEYHKALKSGVGVEQSQLEKQYRLESLVAVLAIVAVRLVNIKFLARARPDETVEVKIFGTKALELLQKRFGPPTEGRWTHRGLVRAMARMGGFIGRRGDGEPGWQTIWRGWHRLMWMTEGAELIQ